MNVDDNFYDDITSFMPSQVGYGLNDFDDIIGTTVPPLDSSLDLHSFVPQNADFALPADTHVQSASTLFDLPQCDEFDFNFSAFPSPATTNESYSSSQRTPSTSSIEGGDYENLDELMNFINDDDTKMEDLTHDSLLAHIKSRNTPSPTGSCSSSGGSSTSGVHSDSSSVVSMQQNFIADSKCNLNKMDQIDVESAVKPNANNTMFSNEGTTFVLKDEESNSFISHATTEPPSLVQPAAEVLIPTLLTLGQTQVNLNVQPSTLIPLQAVPLTTTLSTISNPPPIKVAPKLASKQIKLETTPSVSIAPHSTITNTNETKPAVTTTSTQAIKGALPANSKPKTIFLSSNDFKALMQKMNSNGKSGAKINGIVNAQMPKIIMKTANGKVITANKIVQPLNVTNVNPKIVKVKAPPVFVKQQQHQPAAQATKLLTGNRNAINAAARLQAISTSAAKSASSITKSTTDTNVYRGMIDEKIYKKQQRMIKNRESASLSRKKKKEYVVTLETRINNLEKENCTLKTQNLSLRNQLVAFAQTCNCRNGNASEFVLNSLNVAAKAENQHVKIAPKPSPKSLKQRMSAANVRKNVAVLFAMAFMVSLNVGNFQSYLNKNNIEGDGAVVESIAEEPMAAGRRLLWVESEEEYNENLNRSKRSLEMEVPPLHFLRPVNRTVNNNASTTGAIDRQSYGKSNEPPLTPPKCNGGCALHANQTENLRLASNLHKWIGGNDYLNLSMHTKFGNELENPHGFKLTKDYLDLKRTNTLLPGKRKVYMDYVNESIKKQRKMDTKLENDKEYAKDNVDNDNSLKLYKPKVDEEYLRLFRGIKRQEDTFYVLSFNMDHILLPASVYNKTSRPKMSLMLPAGDPNSNGDVMMMQIDCEVFNTTQLKLKSHMIPEKLRQTIKMQTVPKATDVANNETGSAPASKLREKLPLKYEPPKGKPAVHTYFMVGPKNQAAAAASQQKPRIIKLNNSMIHAAGDTRNYDSVKNSTLFAKMRDTVRGEFGP